MSDNMNHRVRLAMRIRALREQAGLTQDDVAKRLGLSRPSVANIEDARQEPHASALPVLADTLGVTVGDLYDWTLCPHCGGTGVADPEA